MRTLLPGERLAALLVASLVVVAGVVGAGAWLLRFESPTGEIATAMKGLEQANTVVSLAGGTLVSERVEISRIAVKPQGSGAVASVTLDFLGAFSPSDSGLPIIVSSLGWEQVALRASPSGTWKIDGSPYPRLQGILERMLRLPPCTLPNCGAHRTSALYIRSERSAATVSQDWIDDRGALRTRRRTLVLRAGAWVEGK